MSLKVYTYPDECLETVSTPFDFNTDTIPNYDNLEIFEQDMIAFNISGFHIIAGF
jgi:hypothetical protein